MRSKYLRGCFAILSLPSLALFVSEVQASGPAAAQQTALQAQSAITEASLGWHHGGWGWGGGWGYRGFGWGGGWGYGGFGYPAYGYAGYGFVRPVIYTYPAYTYVRYRAPRYCCRYSYVVPTSCCNNTIITPATYTYTVADSTYPAQPVAYTSSYSAASLAANVPIVLPSKATPVYSSGRTYSAIASSNRSSYGSDVYTPTLATVKTSTAVSRPLAPPAPAPYPAAPVAYAKQVAAPQPVAKRTMSVLHAEYLAASAPAEVPAAKVAHR